MTFGRRLLLTGGLAVSLVLLAGVGAWYFLIHDDSPPPVSLDEAVSEVETGATPEDGVTTTPIDEAAATVPAGAAGGGAIGATEWAIAESADSFVGYRIEQELASIGTETVVGRTSAVAGSITTDGPLVTAAQIEADLQELESGESARDSTLRGQALETGSFPTATFALTQPIELSAALDEGASFGETALGDLTLHGVTRPIEIPLEAQVANGVLVVVGSLEIQLADFDIDGPSGPADVLSVEDHATMEVQLFFSAA